MRIEVLLQSRALNNRTQNRRKKQNPYSQFLSTRKTKNKEFHIFDEDIRQWKDTFPGVDVLGELRRARQWSVDNPKRRKTAAGIRNHLSSWMGKSQNLAKGLGSTSAVPNCKNCQYNNPGPCTNLKKPGFDPEKCSAYVGGC